MRRIALLICLFTGLLAGPAFAAHWSVDTGKSKLGFILPWGKEPYIGTFKSWGADIDFDPADLAHAHVVTTINTASEDSGDPETDDSVRNEKGFLSGRFPTAQFEAKNFHHLSGANYVADGTLSIRGITKPLSLAFTLVIAGNSAHMTGKAQTQWADYGMGQDMGMELPDLGSTVTITVDLTATKKG